MAKPSPTIGYYKSFAIQMAEDVKRLNEDNEFALSGGRILTAVDFTEVYSYAKETYGDFLSAYGERLFGVNQENAAILYELHESIMHFYFFEYGNDVYLFDTYKPELNSFARRLEQEQLEHQVIGLPTQAEIAELRNKGDYDEIVRLSETVSSGIRLTKKQAEFVQGFMEENLPSILTLLRDEKGSIRRRLESALSKGNVKLLHNLKSVVGSPHEKTFHRWFNGLNELRPDKRFNNRIDARAVALVYAHNASKYHSASKTKFVLVTRSEHMHELADREYEQGFWRELGGQPLRHPRGSLALLSTKAEILKLGSSELRALLSEWSLRLRASDQATESASMAQDPKEVLSDHVKKEIGDHFEILESAWRSYCKISFERRALDREQATKSEMLDAIKIVTDVNQYKSIVRQRLDQIGRNLLNSSLLVGTLTSKDIEKASRILRSVRSKNRRPKSPALGPREKDWICSATAVSLFTSHGTSMPFQIFSSFRRAIAISEDFKLEPVEFLATLGDSSLLPAELDIPNKAIRERIEAEWYLLYSYTCAAAGSWWFAQYAADIAFARATSARGAKQTLEYQSELSLMLLRCRRNLQSEKNELSKALGDYRVTKPVWPNDMAQRERYIVEEKKVEIIISGLKGAINGELAKQYLEFFDERIQFCEKNRIDHAMISHINNKIYHVGLGENLDDGIYSMPELQDDIKKLERAIRSIWGDRSEYWPDNFVDTLSYAKYKLYSRNVGNVTRKARWRKHFQEEVLKPLKQLAEREYISSVDQRDFRSHYTQAIEFYRKES